MQNNNHFPENSSNDVLPKRGSKVDQKPHCTACLEASPIEPREPTKRLTLEIPLPLHALIKTHCASRGVSMKDEVQAFLEAHYRST